MKSDTERESLPRQDSNRKNMPARLQNLTGLRPVIKYEIASLAPGPEKTELTEIGYVLEGMLYKVERGAAEHFSVPIRVAQQKQNDGAVRASYDAIEERKR
jgi:hypothetical protein